MRNDTAARIDALEARVAQLETANARLVDVASRLFDLVADRTLWVTEELAERDGAAAQTAAELAAAIRSRAPRRIPITVIENVFRKEDDREHFLSWITTLHNLEWRGGKLESLLLRKGLIDNDEHTELTVPHR
jgi:hypothetical protein